jgi:hypothetical protein
MELWEKQCAYIPREFVVIGVIELASGLGRVLWPEDLPWGYGAG